ncbi:hypothetical protein HJG54_29830 [Leptolyngbya sp. NK1-12]|uniref:YbjN domain-containing protein n=1 Tax=Leptolyngbya sp. NK1-12 TaxID=2547451 RepID=A0AA96WK99_9CYAN|nr:hypothetical protein [Leptolyngbya sp. NK1-12]WNZ27113.1 hypothetical protein HJG54_29830 [Leptolyngbya sp. NK1-12]
MFGLKETDPRVGRALSQLEVRYEITSNGDYKVIFDLGNGRSQVGFITSRTFEFAESELREVYSIGLRSFGPFNVNVANALLEYNEQLKIGAWGVVKDAQDNYLAIFTAKVAANLSGQDLMSVIAAVLKSADEVERELGIGDVF